MAKLGQTLSAAAKIVGATGIVGAAGIVGVVGPLALAIDGMMSPVNAQSTSASGTQSPLGSTASPVAKPVDPASTAVPSVTVEAPAPATAASRRRPPTQVASPAARQPDQAQAPARRTPRPAQPSAPTPPPVAAVTPTDDIGSAAQSALAVPGTLIVVDDAFAPITVVPGRELEATQGSTLSSTLQNKPGITSSSFAAGASRPIIRGLDNARVRTQENGISTADVASVSEDHAVPIDPNSIERIEVIRGPATLRYGSGAIGGVVSALNDRIPEAVPLRGFSARLKGGYSSADDGRDGAVSITAGGGPIAFHVDGFTRRADDYETPQGKQRNTFVESEGFSVGGSLVGSWGFAGVNFQRFESQYGIPGAEAVLENTFIDLEQDKINSRGEFKIRSSGVEAIRYWFGHTEYRHFEIADGAAASVFRNDENEGRIEVQHQSFMSPIGRVSGAIGLQASRRTTSGLSLESPADADSLLLPAETETIAAFIFEEVELTRSLTMQLALRHQRAELKGIGPDPADTLLDVARNRTFDPTSASGGFLYALPMGVVARLTAQYAERSPDAQELYSNGPHEATETFELGSVDLTKEKATTFEFGLKKASGALRFDASVFHTRFNGFIFKQLTGNFCEETVASCGTVTEGLELLNFEQRDARFTGAEISAQYDVAPIWRGVWGVEGQFDVVRAEFDGGGNVPRIPPVRIGGGIYYRDAQFLARVNTLTAFDQNRLGDGETSTDGYTLLNAELSYTMTLTDARTGQFGQIAPEFTIGIKGENLLDEEVRNHVSFKKDEVLEPGARVRLFGSIRLN